MGATCKFCGQGFRNRQAVKAHLRACEAYRDRSASGSPPKGNKPKAVNLRQERPGVGVGSADPVMQEVRREEARLKLRQIQADHRAMDEQEADRRRKIHERKEAARQDELERLAKTRRAEEVAGEEVRRERERSIYLVVSEIRSMVGRTGIPPRVVEEIIAAVRRELALLPENANFLDIQAAAAQVTLPILRPAMQRRKEEQAQAQTRQECKAALVKMGLQYAEEELPPAQGMEYFKMRDAIERVERVLKEHLTGSESRGELEQIVDEIIWEGRPGVV